ncbi:phosphatidylinositol glycan anchor biosynthesis class U protein-like [Hydra vulgaris]|uniref:Phosphatidylinositol glycan anchor biosynthesis class U protein-like n=1 Tax=Hydra vulgaris TaxID=6087 RepID=A0ABM4DQL8_HYDVU
MLKFLFVLFFALFLRLMLVYSGLNEFLIRRVEVSSPLTSWFRTRECIALSNYGISPYSGDICHQPPLMIKFFSSFPSTYVPYLFIAADLLTGIVMCLVGKNFVITQLVMQEKEKKNYAEDAAVLILNKDQLKNTAFVAMSVYLLHPYSIITCAAQSSLIVNNLLCVLLLLALVKGWSLIGSICAAVLTYLSFYPVIFLAPIVINAFNISTYKKISTCKCLFGYVITLACLLKCSFMVYGTWNFIYSVYSFMLMVNDLTPNMGLTWYFFSEMFDHFKLFFLCVYQMSVFVFTIPIAVIFRKYPILICYSLFSLVSLFKSYPNFGDLSVPMAMLPFWCYLYRYTRNVLFIGTIFIVASALAPCMWYLWIYAGSGNGNFFYAITLLYASAQIFLLSDILYAFLRREYHLLHGMKPKTSTGQEGIIVMK